MTNKSFRLFTFFLLLLSSVSAQEDCSNGLDDDGDGLIDLNDFFDCPCLPGGSIGTAASIIPNPSFENFGLCPSVPNQITEADDWDQMTQGGPDYFNLCDPFSGVVPTPIPDGNGVAGFSASNGFLEYIGAVLVTPMIAGQDYRLDVDMAGSLLDGAIQNVLGPPLPAGLNLTLYGNVATNNFPIATTLGLTTPAASNWEVLGTVNYLPQYAWSTETILFTAADNYQMIAFGPPAGLPFDYINAANLPYFFVDNMILNLESSFGEALTLSGELCLDDVLITADVPVPTTQWYFNGEAIPGETNDDLDVSATGLGEGDYSLAINAGTPGCAFASMSVPPSIYPELDFTISNLCPPGDITFTSNSNISSGTIDVLTWDVGAIYNTPVAVHPFPMAGSYPITLSATSDIGCVADTTFNIDVEAPPMASFTYVPGCIGAPIDFTDTSTPGNNGSAITSYSWDFGDTQNGSDQNPSHEFSDANDYNVNLTVSTDGGCSDDTTIVVTSSPSPIVNFTNTIACVGAGPIEFASETTISSGSIVDLDWDFGDGETAGFQTNPQHIYTDAGDYDVTLTATSDLGCTDFATNAVTVSSVTADFTANNPSGCSPHCVQFNESSTANGGEVSQWLWTFSNGISSSEQNPEICFSSSSSTANESFDVQLVVSNNLGCTDSIFMTDIITAGYIPEANFEYSPQELTTINPDVFFTNTSVGANAYYWTFGDEYATTDVDPNYTFDSFGLIPVTLIAQNTASCSDSLTIIIKISPEELIYVPNCFTPDEDGLNDLFAPVISGANIESYDFKLYDRYGHLVFHTKDPQEKWNGQYRINKDFYIQDGSYPWLMTIRFEDNTELMQRRGSVTVIR